MPNWSGMILTKKGLNLQAKVEAGVPLNFTKMKVGDGILGSGQTLENLSDLISPKQTLGITSVTPQDGGLCKISSLVTNIGLENGYYVREVGLFAADPDLGEILYAVSTDSSPDYLPPEGGSVVVNEQLDIYVGIGNAANITANINPSGLVTVADLEEHNNSEQSHPNYKRGWAIGRNYVLQGIPNGSGVQEAIRKQSDTVLEMPAGVLLNFAAGMNDYGPVDIVEKLGTAKTLTPAPADAFTIPLAYTEDLCEGGTAISGGDLSGYPKANAFDNNNSTYWSSSQTGTAVNGSAFIGYNFGKNVAIRKVRFVNPNATTAIAPTVAIEYSMDGTSWTIAVNCNVPIVASLTVELTIPYVASAHYWRMRATSPVNTGAAWTTYEIEMMEALETHYVAADRNPETKEVSMVTTKNKPRVAGESSATTIPGYYTADLCEGGTPISGGDYYANPKELAFNNNPSDEGWHAVQTSANQLGVAYLGYSFILAKEIRKIRFKPQIVAIGNMSSVKIQYADENLIWQDVVTVSLNPNYFDWNEITFASVGTHKNWRVLANNNLLSTNHWGITEMEMMEWVEPQTITSDNAKYTDNVCIGGQAVASSSYTTDGRQPVHAFDGISATFWQSATLGAGSWIGYDLGVARKIKKISIKSPGNGVNDVTSAKIKYSNNKVDWTELQTVNNLKVVDDIILNDYPGARYIVVEAATLVGGNVYFSMSEMTMHELATDLDYYDPINGLTKRFDGTTWTDKQRIYVGEIQVDSAGRIVKVTNYPIGLGNLRVKDAERKDEPVALGQIQVTTITNGALLKIPAIIDGVVVSVIKQMFVVVMPLNSAITITLPLAYPNKFLSIQAVGQANSVTPGENNQSAINALIKDNTSFYAYNDDTAQSVYFEAIGY